jgi:hypothetical protein
MKNQCKCLSPNACGTASNGLGYRVEALTNIGWLKVDALTFKKRCEADRHLKTMVQGRELRVYEVLK